MKRHGWSIRRKFTALLLLPLVSLAALCGYAAYLSLGNALTLSHVDTIGNHLAAPLGRTVVALEIERREAVVAASVAHTVSKTPSGVSKTPDGGSKTPDGGSKTLDAGRVATDTAVAAFLKEAHDDGVRRAESDSVREGVDRAEKSLATLDALRRGTDAGTSTPEEILAAYTAVNGDIAEALRAMTILPDQDAQDFGQALYTEVPAGDLLSREDALISAAAASSGRLDAATYRTLVQDIGARRLLSAEVVKRLPEAQRKPFLELAAPGGPMAKVGALEDKIIGAGPSAGRLPFTIDQWRSAYDATAKASSTTALDDISLVFTRTSPPARRAFAELIVAGVLGLSSLIVSIVMSVRMARSLSGDINRLNTSSRNLTEDALRDVVGRLRRGETVDVRAGMTRPVFVNREMAELGAAFDALQRTAVELAEEDVRLHQGINQLYVNLARRSQVLLHRQLSLLDVMERHEEDANTLDRLFELDQLATRMRRYAEGLLIVSGATPGRFWRRAVPVVDVVRGGIAETEQYARVVVLPVPTVGIQGRAVADVIHLLAELIENAQVFSPSDSEVRVSVGTAASGLIVEIDDRGLGMPPEELAAANEQLNAPLHVSALDSTRLGLVTVGRLAQRHGIEVTLRRSPYGGVNVVVLIPDGLLEWGPAGAAGPAVSAAGAAGRLPGGAPDEQPSALLAPGAAPPAAVGPAPIAPADPAREAHFQDPPHSTYAPHTPPTPASTPAPAPGPAPAPVSRRGYGPDGPDGPDHVPGGQTPVRPAPAPAPPQPGATIDGLPCRVPQASLAGEATVNEPGDRGQLMDWGRGDHERRVGPGAPSFPGTRSPAAPGQPAGGPAGPAGPLPPEHHHAAVPPRAQADPPPQTHPAAERPDQVRMMMSALQAGAARARLEQYAAPGDPAGRPRGDALSHDAHAAFPAHTPAPTTPTPRKRG
ncbi:nitrate- and nitrite sensing domain-containing protein [Streptomyces sp. NPDC056161]|uniref:sensor histidine kinase n=1 Tax=Streptomyces sp. NPDC056161 TaxID=3345732 RepID=UPI0035D774F3